MLKSLEVNFEVKCRPEGFWSATEVWIKKPHVANKRLCGAKVTEYTDVDTDKLRHSLTLLTETSDQELAEVYSFLHVHTANDGHESARSWCISSRTIIPKADLNCEGVNVYREIIIKDLIGQAVTFLPVEEDSNGQVILRKSNIYQIHLKLKTDEWVLSLCSMRPDEWHSDGVTYPKLSWLTAELLPKLARWAMESKASEFKSTLSLIPIEKYSFLYQQLKNKYKEMVKVWPEVTDPEKFVFEDVAIATYLLVLWGEDRAEKGATSKQSFVDLGCGNGLLVHILTNEGHPGKGIDVRKRKIWSMYGSSTHLEEKAITPSSCSLFPETDWLIGNHSDELTPWIPVIAARSSYACRYFVIPCCFFDFGGKYQRRCCKKSQYREYIDFISEVSTACGFQTDEDCLRIPSTKRVCLIGRNRTYERSEEGLAEARRADYIRGRQASGRGSPEHPAGPPRQGGGQESPEPGSEWGTGFRPREKTEPVRNCGALPRCFVEDVVLKVATALLGLSGEAGKEEKEEEEKTPSDKDGKEWNAGGSLSIREVADLLGPSTLQALKRECGGLQTLLRNSHQVFRVEGGRVHVRDWRSGGSGQVARAAPKRKPETAGARKTRLCWFHTHHPHGCPLTTEDCTFAHGDEDLQHSTRPPKKFRN
ncbi:putative tRNA (uracil-O(2)-)-methyltransferase [Brachyhypopomus gauderio]|uniref:putative tRNA (uracil-O(2)-)-methyltransferase n=1 Tax=Brachyhypopomus gauderio TaxID=698409 RepID=UPI0040423FE1